MAELQKHREAQKQGRASIFKDYRITICSVLRDYRMDRQREQVPQDSLRVHG
jgi:heme-degrading monooxygenase HmoA